MHLVIYGGLEIEIFEDFLMMGIFMRYLAIYKYLLLEYIGFLEKY